jgi:hypothetical protein
MIGTALAGGAILAAVRGKPESELWKVLAVAMVALAVLGVVLLFICGVVAFVTRPVSDAHDAALKASAAVLAASLSAGQACDYGEGSDAQEDFCAHFSRLGRELATWDKTLLAPALAELTLDARITALMTEHAVVDDDDVNFGLSEIKKYARAVAIERAEGRLHRSSSL